MKHEPAPATVGNGAALVVAGAYVYAFRGGNNDNFWRYDNENGWGVSVANAPASVSSGGALTWDEGNYIYAFRGGDYDNFWRYDVVENTWQQRASIPRGINSNNGHRLGYADGRIYAWYCRGGAAIPEGTEGDFWRLDLIHQKALI